MAKWDDFVKAVRAGVSSLATGALKNYLTQLQTDAEDYLKQSEDQLKRWTQALAKGYLSKEEFDSLVMGRADLAKLKALTDAGIAMSTLKKLRNDLIDLVIDKAFAVFL